MKRKKIPEYIQTAKGSNKKLDFLLLILNSSETLELFLLIFMQSKHKLVFVVFFCIATFNSIPVIEDNK